MKDKNFKWKGYEWQVTPFWGDHHKEKPSVWYGKDSVNIDSRDCLILDCLYKPKKFTDGITREYNVGYVVCKSEFKYGVFEWMAKLPVGLHMWPGLWLASNQEWPPEIDCMEAWSRADKATYIKRLLWVDLHPTMHWKENGVHWSEPKFNTPRCWIDNGWNDFKVEWRKDFVKVWYNGHLAKKFTDKKMLEHFNRKDIKMFPIMTFDIWEDKPGDFSEEKYDKYVTEGLPFIIRDFKYTE